MPRYTVSIPLHASTTYECDADSPEQALEKARDEAGSPGLCHQCSRECELGDVDEQHLDIDCVMEIEGKPKRKR